MNLKNKKTKYLFVVCIIFFAVLGAFLYYKTANKKDIEVTKKYIDSNSVCDAIYKTKVKYFDYKTFIKKMAPNSDNYYAIKATHDCANKYNKPVKVTKGTYHIYKKSDKIKVSETIKVMTDTDLGGSTIYIHDEEGIINTNKMKYNIYEIAPNNNENYKTISIDDIIDDLSNIKNNPIIEKLKGNNSWFVRIENPKKRVFIRTGVNAKKENELQGDAAVDVFRVNKDGKVLDPLFWTYSGKEDLSQTTVKIYPMSKKITFKNAKFYNIVDKTDYYPNSNDDVYNHYDYAKRGLLVKRSNTTVDNIYHGYVDSNYNIINESTYGYFGFFNIGNVGNIRLTDLKVQALKVNAAHQSSYDLNFSAVANMNIYKVKMNDFEDNDNYYNRPNQLNGNYWGVTGSNTSKNIRYIDCALNRIDTHRGVYNLTVKDSVLGRYGINQDGFGNMVVDNVTVRYTNQFIRLRDDYGSTWNGTIKVTNSKIIPGNNNPVYLVSARIVYDSKDSSGKSYVHNYGYDLRIPNVIVNNFEIASNTNKFYVFNIKDSKANGNLKAIKNNYIKSNTFNFYYPSDKNITIQGVQNKSGLITSNKRLFVK